MVSLTAATAPSVHRYQSVPTAFAANTIVQWIEKPPRCSVSSGHIPRQALSTDDTGMHTTVVTDWMLASGLLILRVVLGTLLVAHSGQKLLGWFGGVGLRNTAGYFEQIGFRPGVRFVTAASLAETTSGLLIGFGLFGPVGPALVISIMLVAAVSVHRGHGLFAGTNGFEVPMLYATIALGLALLGYGRYSVDTLIGLSPAWTPAITVAALALGVLAGISQLTLRRPQLR
jgi:putative oxidoreductase